MSVRNFKEAKGEDLPVSSTEGPGIGPGRVPEERYQSPYALSGNGPFLVKLHNIRYIQYEFQVKWKRKGTSENDQFQINKRIK